MLRQLRLSFLLIVTFITLFVLGSCNIWKDTHLDPSTFDEYADSFFYSVIGKDELTCNFYFAHRDEYGLDSFEPSLPTPSLSNPLNLIITSLVLGRVDGYDYNELNADQKMVSNIIKHTLDYMNSLTTEMGYLSNNYLGTYLGYQAQLPILLAEYHFRNKTDLDNYLKFLDLVPNAFESYYDFEVKKADKGYGMPDYVIDNVISQCNKFISGIDDESTFLIKYIDSKIDDCEFLTLEEKDYYKNSNDVKVKTSLRDGYYYIAGNLGNLKGKATNEEGLAHYVKEDGTMIGRNYYETKFKYITGYDMTCSEAIDYIEEKIELYYTELGRLKALIDNSTNLKEQLEKINNDEIMLMDKTPSEQIDWYIEMMEQDFPSLSYKPEIELKFVDSSMQENFSPAAYMTSPIDEIGKESIYLNPKSVYLVDSEGNLSSTFDGNYLFTTLAHEGLPGHLYQTCYFKSLDVHPLRKILKNIGTTEGWATYAENYVYNYLRGSYPDEILDYLITMEKFQAAVYSRLDLGIHYDGWSLDEAYDFMSRYFSLKGKDAFVKGYRQLVEIPTNYQQYFFTYLKLCDLYDTVSNSLGEDFNVKDYHKTVLDCGCAPMKYIEQYVYDYYGIE